MVGFIVTYRDDTEQLRARVERLEGELADARRTIEKIQGDSGQKSGLGRALMGGPTSLSVERRIDGEVDESIHEEVVEMLRRRFGVVGQVTTLGRSLGWTSAAANQRLIDVSVAPIGGTTVVRVNERLANLAGGLFGGVVGGVGGGGLGLVIPAALALNLRAFMPLFMVLWFLATYLVTRSAYARLAEKRQREVTATADAIAELVSQAARRRVRLDPASEALGSAEAEAAAEQELEAEVSNEKAAGETPFAARRR